MEPFDGGGDNIVVSCPESEMPFSRRKTMTKKEFEIQLATLKIGIMRSEANLDRLYTKTCSDLALARAHNALDSLYLDYRELMTERKALKND
jgi:hypothetical protein